jgi:hypothetical protein
MQNQKDKSYNATIVLSEETIETGDIILFQGRFGDQIHQVREIQNGVVYTYSGGPIGPENTGVMLGLQHCKKISSFKLQKSQE